MKRNLTILTVVILLLGLSGFSYAQQIQQKPQIKERLRNAMEIRREIREIERQAIESDAELQGIMDKIRELHKQLREKLEAKLANNSEYQQLKKELEEMRKEWKEKGFDGPPAGVPPAPKTDTIKQKKGK